MFENPIVQFIAHFYERLIKIAGSFQSLFLLWLRLTWGHQFFIQGMSKLGAIDKTTEYFTSLSVPAPIFHVYFVGYIEVIGGILMMVGLASRFTSLFLIYVTLSALAIAHAPALTDFRFITHPSLLVLEAPYPYFITSLIILCFGPGRFAIDGLIKRWADRQPKF